MAVRTDGSLWGWGGNIDGLLGDGTTDNRLEPIKIMDSISAVSSGIDHVLALGIDGCLWSWGRNTWGELGDGTTINRLSPIRINCDF